VFVKAECLSSGLTIIIFITEAKVPTYPVLFVLLLAGVLCGTGGGLLGQPHPPRGGGQVHPRHRPHVQAPGACPGSGNHTVPVFPVIYFFNSYLRILLWLIGFFFGFFVFCVTVSFSFLSFFSNPSLLYYLHLFLRHSFILHTYRYLYSLPKQL
jgi:hypothetical protein